MAFDQNRLDAGSRFSELGELTDREGRTRDVHLKGSGPTPFGRRGDGLAAIGPMLREYVVSEAMAGAGTATATIASANIILRMGFLPFPREWTMRSSRVRTRSRKPYTAVMATKPRSIARMERRVSIKV